MRKSKINCTIFAYLELLQNLLCQANKRNLLRTLHFLILVILNQCILEGNKVLTIHEARLCY